MLFGNGIVEFHLTAESLWQNLAWSFYRNTVRGRWSYREDVRGKSWRQGKEANPRGDPVSERKGRECQGHEFDGCQGGMRTQFAVFWRNDRYPNEM